MTAPSCRCRASKELSKLRQRDHLMQFLMVLKGTFEGVREHILKLEPLPIVSEAYAMVFREERQRDISLNYSSSLQNVAMQIRGKKARSGQKRVLSAADSRTPRQETPQSAIDEQAIAKLIRGELRIFMEGVTPGTLDRTRSDEFEDFTDGSKQHIDIVENVQIPNNIILTSVLHVPSLKFNFPFKYLDILNEIQVSGLVCFEGIS
ncbi:hypothetical protein Sango_1061800 [Sesamum angolense]|uniref:Uncharacterized protein n=1 Tax=Sesamum angolense TaxID=2727404 RepID=A0AAE1X155_9LAMI|nr:hypothetical protein Sango_1061800 [Sesamum angolense]